VTIGESVKAFAGCAVREKSAQHGFDALRHLLRGDRSVDFSAELGLGAAAAAEKEVIAFDFLLLALLDPGREQPDIADIMLGA